MSRSQNTSGRKSLRKTLHIWRTKLPPSRRARWGVPPLCVEHNYTEASKSGRCSSYVPSALLYLVFLLYAAPDYMNAMNAMCVLCYMLSLIIQFLLCDLKEWSNMLLLWGKFQSSVLSFTFFLVLTLVIVRYCRYMRCTYSCSCNSCGMFVYIVRYNVLSLIIQKPIYAYTYTRAHPTPACPYPLATLSLTQISYWASIFTFVKVKFDF